QYPQYFDKIIKDIVIGKGYLSAIPASKTQEVYDEYKEQLIPIIMRYKDRSFVELFFSITRGGEAPFSFLLDRLHAAEAPEFAQAMKKKIPELSPNFLLKSHLYVIYPKESKD